MMLRPTTCQQPKISVVVTKARRKRCTKKSEYFILLHHPQTDMELVAVGWYTIPTSCTSIAYQRELTPCLLVDAVATPKYSAFLYIIFVSLWSVKIFCFCIRVKNCRSFTLLFKNTSNTKKRASQSKHGLQKTSQPYLVTDAS